jgi:hypothetical protein
MWAKWDGNSSAGTSKNDLPEHDNTSQEKDGFPRTNISDNQSTSASPDCPSIPFEILTFSNWAFGPQGFPNLQVLAYGDFSYDGRFSQYNTLMCRDTSWSIPGNLTSRQQETKVLDWTFRRLKKSDVALWELVKENADFLGACPTDLILAD